MGRLGTPTVSGDEPRNSSEAAGRMALQALSADERFELARLRRKVAELV
jgi:hypothetical protein